MRTFGPGRPAAAKRREGKRLSPARAAELRADARGAERALGPVRRSQV
jgi:hypothetical protein